MKIFKLPLRTPLCIGWIGTDLNPADTMSRVVMGEQLTSMGWYVVGIECIPAEVYLRAEQIQSPWMGKIQGHPGGWTCQPPAQQGGEEGEQEHGTPMHDGAFQDAWSQQAVQCRH